MQGQDFLKAGAIAVLLIVSFAFASACNSSDSPPGDKQALVSSTATSTSTPAADEDNSEGNAFGHMTHDPGPHPTYDQIMTLGESELVKLSPVDTLETANLPLLKEQLAQVRAVAEKYRDVNVAMAEGYFNTTNDIPYMGAHFISGEYLSDGLFDPMKPEGLLYSKLGNPDGEWQIVGVWFLQIPPSDGSTYVIKPEGFASDLDYWHAHENLCLRDANMRTRENISAEDCAAASGEHVPDLRWMGHAWVMPEVAQNNKGVFAYLNATLFRLQTGQEPLSVAE